MINDDLSCQRTSTPPHPSSDDSTPRNTTPSRLTPQQWGQEQAALAPPWSDKLFQEALATLGVISLLTREGRGTLGA